jgi:hypothetical protein
MLIAYFVIWFFILFSYVFNILMFIDYKQTNALKSSELIFYIMFLVFAPFVIILKILNFLIKKIWK